MMKNWKIVLFWSFIISFNIMDAQKKYGYINLKNEVVIPAKFDNAQKFSNGLAAVKINGLWGFINTKGEVVIAPKYGTVFNFSNHIAKVSITEVDFFGTGKYLYINEKGEEIPENKVQGEPVFFDGLKLVRMKNDKFGFEDTKGVMVIPAIYDYARDFNGYGWTACSKGGSGTMGCINSKGEMIVPFQFDFIDYNFGKFIVAKTGNGENRIYKTDGTFIKVDGVDEIYGFNKEGLAIFKLGQKSGFLNTNGKKPSKTTYDETGFINEGLAFVTVENQLQVLDVLNNKIVCTIPNAKSYNMFKNGIARIEINKKFGFVDKYGKTIIPADYLDLGYEFEDGLAYFAEIPKVEPKVVMSTPVLTNAVAIPKIDLVINDETFKKELLRLRLDADRGFSLSKGGLLEKTKYGSYYDAKSSLYNDYNKDCVISYSPSWYAASTKENMAQRYFFSQSFDYSDKLGQFVYDNAERIFDEIAKENSFKKKFYKLDKEEKKKYKLIQYFKNEQVVLELSLTFDKKTSSINIFSDLKPDDQPNYLGCMVLYNIQSENLVSANIYYVYGKKLDKPEYLYGKIISPMEEHFKRYFKKYEWMPGATEQYVIEKLSNLGLDQRFRSAIKIDTEGYGIK